MILSHDTFSSRGKCHLIQISNTLPEGHFRLHSPYQCLNGRCYFLLIEFFNRRMRARYWIIDACLTSHAPCRSIDPNLFIMALRQLQHSTAQLRSGNDIFWRCSAHACTSNPRLIHFTRNLSRVSMRSQDCWRLGLHTGHSKRCCSQCAVRYVTMRCTFACVIIPSPPSHSHSCLPSSIEKAPHGLQSDWRPVRSLLIDRDPSILTCA